MNVQLPPIKELLLKSWRTFKSNATLMILVLLIYAAIHFSSKFIFEVIEEFAPFSFISILHTIVWLLLSSLLLLGIYKIAFEISQHRHAKLLDIFKNGNLLLQFCAAYILYAIIVPIGIVLLIVPGIIWAVQFSFYPLLIIDKNLNPIEALKASSRLTHGYKWQLFNIFLILFMINVVGCLLIGIGLLVTIPVTLFAYVSLYRELSRD